MLVSTDEAINILTNSADLPGLIVDLGEGATQHGHYYGKSSNPSTDHTSLGKPNSITGFTSQLANLEAGTKYFFKAYITDGQETVFGKEKSFTTVAASAPTITTNAVTSITQTGAVSGGNITSDGGAPVTARGVCWNTDTGPSISNSKTTDDAGTGSFTSNLNNLTPGTLYFVRAYATNIAGTVYGNEVSFTTTAVSVQVPTLTTTEASNITQTTAISGGNITSNGGATVTVSGVCWSTSPNPVATGNHTIDGTATGTFTSSITGLTANTTYYVRAYATNSVGTGYGNEISFTPTSVTTVVPTLTTTATTNISQTTATSGGNITSNGGAAVTASGVCWSTSTNPVASGNHTTDGSATGIFTSSITGLTANTTYYLRAYATNSVGTAYGNELSFTTESSISGTVTDFDGNVYNTINIGTQVWMKENLKTTHYADGTPLIDGTGVGTISNDYTTKYMFTYEDIESNAVTYGRLYTWAAVMNGANSSAAIPSGIQGVCPTGWHVPSISEWIQLIDYLGGAAIAGGPLKEAGNAHWEYSNVGATNSSGFTGLPHGYRNNDGNFYGIGTYGAFLTSTSVNSYSSRCVMLRTENTEAYSGDYNKDDAKAIRCVMGLGAGLPTLTTTAVTAITQTTATSGGNITSNGGATVTASGVCWNTSGSPVVTGSHTSDGATTGTFTSSITGLTAGTTYYVRAYATNSIGTAYGDEMQFKTLCVGPTVTTTAATNVGQTTATLTGTINANNFSTIPLFKYGTTTSYGSTINSTPYSVDGSTNVPVYVDIINLTPGTLYHYVVLANSSCGTEVYGNDMTFTTLLPAPTITNFPDITKNYGDVPFILTPPTSNSTGAFSYSSNNPSVATISGNTVTITGVGTSTITATQAVTASFTSGTITATLTVNATKPTLATTAISAITSTSAISGGDIISNGGAAVTASGICWSTSPDPVATGSHTNDGAAMGSFTSVIAGLANNTVYYVRAYATNIIGTAYGNEVTFTTDPITVSDIEGNIYNVIRIGSQVWLLENLRVKRYNNDEPINSTNADISGETAPNYQWSFIELVLTLQDDFQVLIDAGLGGLTFTQLEAILTPSQLVSLRMASKFIPSSETYTIQMMYSVCIAYSTTVSQAYGLLYTWYAAIDSRKICPVGWHVPSDSELSILSTYLGGLTTAGGKLKEVGTSHWQSPNDGATNESGFTALPGGAINSVGTFFEVNYTNFLWSTTEDNSSSAWTRTLSHSSAIMDRSAPPKNNGFSVRCIKD